MDWDKETYSTPSTAQSADTHAPITLESMVEAARKMKEMSPPPASPDQCKCCGTILGKKFGGLIDIEARPIFFGPLTAFGFAGPVAAYLCPDCWDKVKAIAVSAKP
jgi:hypothetical protein